MHPLSLTPHDWLLSDRRRATRFSLGVPTRYRFRDMSARWDFGESLDFSLNGIRLAFHDRVSHGTNVEVNMELPQMFESLNSEGSIVWMKPSSHSKFAVECGIAFKKQRTLSSLSLSGKIMYFIANQLCRYAIQQKGTLKSRNAETLTDLETAYRLVYNEYVERGYCQPNPSKMRYTFFNTFPDSRTFLLEREGRLLSTISLIVDSPCGLPMEEIFSDEVAKIRKEGRRLAEASMLALDRTAFWPKRFSLSDILKFSCAFLLFKHMFDYARYTGVTDLLIFMHPRHEALYRYLTFKTIGATKEYPGGYGKPALPMHIDIKNFVGTVPTDHGVGAFFLKENIPKELLERHFQWDAETVREMLMKKQSLWDSLSSAAQDYLQRSYPGLT